MIKLKLLSGPFAGLEYNLENGDTVLQLVCDIAAESATAGTTYTAAENVLLVPTNAARGRIVIRATAHEHGTEVSVAEQCEGSDQPLVFVPAVTHAPQAYLGLYLAIDTSNAGWHAAVLDFAPPCTAIVPERDARHPLSVRKARPWPLTLVLLGLVAAGVAGGAYYLNLPEVQSSKLSAVLAQAPGNYEVIADADRNLYVFADDSASAAWAERAVRRADRWKARVIVRQQERERVEAWLLRHGLQPVIVRLQDAAAAEIVLNGVPSEAQRERVLRLAQAELPYAKHLKVTGVSDATLVAMARDELKTLGVFTRSDVVGGRTSISNTVFLDDATLASMAGYSRQFEQQWGARRVTVNARLWDDVLRGRSFRYAPGQLMSVGQGRWEYSENLR